MATKRARFWRLGLLNTAAATYIVLPHLFRSWAISSLLWATEPLWSWPTTWGATLLELATCGAWAAA
eukprot:4945928-Lingulodinium_polyedra.AAC.1